jgi:asparagine synthase (glutamine-hydrolysing)
MLRVLNRVHLANDHEYSDMAFTGTLVEIRSPLLDQRILEFFLAAPTVPLCLDKWLFRELLKNRLPRAVVRRAKAPLPQFPVTGYIRRHGTSWAQLPSEARHYLSCFVNVEALPTPLVWDARHEAKSFVDLSPLSLYKWLQSKVV